MLDGVCPKCHQPEVCERDAHLSLSRQQGDALRLRLLVCVACGYTETYTHAEHLPMIAQSAHWSHVRPAQQPAGHAPVTGATVRLVPPTNPQAPQPPADQAGLSPKKRCPVCQSDKLIPGARLGSHDQSVYQNLTAIVHGNPEALVFRGTKLSHLRAWICSRCGHASLFANSPGELYAAYLASRR